MTAAPRALDRFVEFLGELGPRWGLPAEACRVHGHIFLLAKPVAEAELRKALDLSDAALRKALDWLADYGLVERVRGDTWRTHSDPWELMVRALEERQRRELGPALDLLRECQRMALAERGPRTVATQVGKLLQLAEDIAAINAQAQRLSPRTLRHMIGLGGLAARFMDRTLGRRDRP